MDAKRTAICLGCRTCLPEGVSCDIGCDAQILSLADELERHLVVQSAWDNQNNVRFAPKHQPADYSPMRIPAAASSLGGLLLVTGIGGSILGSIVLIVPWMLLPVLAGSSSRRLSSAAPRQLENSSMHYGKVRAVENKPAPASKQPCVAFSIRLHYKVAQSDTLIDAYSHGFDVDLDDGRIAHIPTGRIRLEGERSIRRFGSKIMMNDWWPEIDPLKPIRERYPPYPHNQIHEVIVTTGQRILLRNELVLTTRQHRGADYRDTSANILEPRGVPHVVLE